MENLDISKITTYQAGAAQASMHRLLQKLSDAILKPYNITKMQWMIIGTTLDAGKNGLRVSDLADSLGTTISYLTTMVNLLESRGILIRTDNSTDSRSSLISVSPGFLPKCAEIESALRKGLRQSIYAKVDPGEFRTYMKVLYQLQEIGKQASS